MPRPLYGYRVSAGIARVDPIPAAVVCAVLAVRSQRRHGLACRCVRSLIPGLSTVAVCDLVARIRSHAADYAAGRARADLPPDPTLRLTRHRLDSRSPSPAGGVERSRRNRSQ